MATYLCPVDDIEGDAPYIVSINASSFTQAEDKIENLLREDYEIRDSIDWNDFIKAANEIDLYIGNIYDKEEF